MAIGAESVACDVIVTAHPSQLAAEVHHQLLAASGDVATMSDESVRHAVTIAAPLFTSAEVDDAVQQINHMRHGLGPLEPLLADHTIGEVMVNGPGAVWVERAGSLRRSEVTIDARTLQVVIERIIGPLGLRADRLSPFVDARLTDGSRVNVAVPPLALDGPYLTIRRFRPQPFVIEDFCSAAVALALRCAVEQRQNLLICGGTGSGKTSLLNALGAFVGRGERVITIEDAAELRLPGEHTVRLEARPGNAEGVGDVTIRDLVRNALRMRPDRLIVGEVRGAEALDMVQAMNTGHSGSMSTCHANSPDDALQRVESMALMSDVDMPHRVIREQLRRAVDLVVHVTRSSAGDRSVDSVVACGPTGSRWLVQSGELCSEPSGVDGATQ